MKLTKYNHACLTLENNGSSLVIDPGIYSSDFVVPPDVEAVVITHVHSDHFELAKIQQILQTNPNAQLIGTDEVVAKSAELPFHAVHAGDHIVLTNFVLDFFGGEHATIHPSLVTIQNVGVMVNKLLYYPGDSLLAPNQPVDTLALPVAAPWLKISETIDFLHEVRPRFAFPTHDAILSDIGKNIVDERMSDVAADTDIIYQRIDGQVVEL